jgi:membrane protease YdiL (CAAX protease family)
MNLRSYWQAAREPRYSLTFALPLLLLYEVLSAALSGSAVAGVRNGADVLLKTLFFTLGGRNGLFVFGLLLVAVGAVLIARDWRAHPGRLNTRVLGTMFLESLLYAVLFGFVVATLTSLVLHPALAIGQPPPGGPAQLPLATQLVVSLGAGIYEELLFRVLLVSGLAALFAAWGLRRGAAVASAVVASALIFSAFHYVGPFGDRLELSSFTFRAIAGLVFSGMYVARGLGITAWTHAMYDVLLTLLR